MAEGQGTGEGKFLVESIGAEFSDRALPKLAERFDRRSKEGYELHTVFKVEQPGGCLGFGARVSTYLAVYRKQE